MHRLVRISPFDAQSRRHTAFAQVDVAPLVDDDVEVEIDEDDLRVDTYRASGAGGQHVNKTDSAVRITHVPTGIVVQCQNERSQTQNKATAMRLLRARLLEEEERKRAEELAAERGEQKAVEWGSQIRSYTLHPSHRVKDHRTGYEIGDAQRVLDGDLDGFVREYLLRRAPPSTSGRDGAGDGLPLPLAHGDDRRRRLRELDPVEAFSERRRAAALDSAPRATSPDLRRRASPRPRQVDPSTRPRAARAAPPDRLRGRRRRGRRAARSRTGPGAVVWAASLPGARRSPPTTWRVERR